MGIIIAATGGDKQEHVSSPLEKFSLNKGVHVPTNKGKHELETIEENHREEDLGLS